MNFDIGAIGRPQGPAPAQSAAKVPPPAELEAGATTHGEAVEVDTFPASPPPEVSAAISVAAQAYDNLAAQGKHLHFSVNQETARLTIQVVDKSGNVVDQLSPLKVLHVAAGGALS